jgi:hypothetical protein
MSSQKIVLLSLIGFAIILASCSAPTPQIVEVTRVVPQTMVVTQVVQVEKLITATPEPTQPLPTPTLAPTSTELIGTNQPAAQGTLSSTAQSTSSAAQQGTVQPVTQNAAQGTPQPGKSNVPGGPSSNPDNLNAWCMPKGMINPEDVAKTGNMPQDARPVKFNKDGKPELIIQVQSCTFVYTFPQAVEKGTKFLVHDIYDHPFINIDLTPTTDNPNKAFAIVTQEVLVNPPAWSIQYRVEVTDSQSTSLRSDMVTFKRGWIPALCYGGIYPDAVTGRCPDLPESHPWDPWFGYSPNGGYNEGVTTPGPVRDRPILE